MCGIAGLIALDAPAPPPDGEAIVRAMLERLEHRGPDGEGVETVGPAVLGHRRLAIIDLTGGAQPIASGPVHLVFNGEIYNFAELRDELAARGHAFRTRSDSEVLAASLAEWGREALPRLRGMFAFAGWDTGRRRLILARDRLGKKPLYWARRGDLLAFASELPALLAWKAIAPELDAQSLANYLRYGYIASPRSALRDVHKLPAASVVEVGGSPRRYWNVRYEPKSDEQPPLLPLLDAAVADRLIADVPVGAFLSGGLDSALVVARAAKKTDLRTFTVGFSEDASLDERQPARALAEWAGARHSERALQLDVASLIDTVVKRLGEPLGDPSALPTYLVAELARGQVKVVVTGDGGDETFAGYHRYARTRLSLLYPRLPRPIRRAAAMALRFSGVSQARLDEVEARALRPAGRSYADAMSVFDAGSAARLLGPDHPAAPDQLLEELHDEVRGDWLDKLLYTDLRSYLSESVLVKVDRMTMAHGIEARSPLLDHRLVELAARLPAAWKRPPGKPGKQPLRELAAQLLPPHLVDRPKRGFDIPLKSWMSSGPLRQTVEQTLRESLLVRDGWLAREPLLAEVAPGRDGSAPLGNRLWSVYVLELWYRLVKS
jgi:asparagine synthase (glutamine-hydrolysing)